MSLRVARLVRAMLAPGAMSTHSLRRVMRNLVFATVGFAATAHAEHVDWGPYLEPAGAKPMPVKASESPVAAAPPKNQVARQAAKPVAKAKPKAKPAARKPHR
jgi:hypothetical protein